MQTITYETKDRIYEVVESSLTANSDDWFIGVPTEEGSLKVCKIISYKDKPKRSTFVKDVIKATLALFLFKRYTNLPRWMEIGFSIQAWFITASLFYFWLR